MIARVRAVHLRHLREGYTTVSRRREGCAINARDADEARPKTRDTVRTRPGANHADPRR